MSSLLFIAFMKIEIFAIFCFCVYNVCIYVIKRSIDLTFKIFAYIMSEFLRIPKLIMSLQLRFDTRSPHILVRAHHTTLVIHLCPQVGLCSLNSLHSHSSRAARRRRRRVSAPLASPALSFSLRGLPSSLLSSPFLLSGVRPLNEVDSFLITRSQSRSRSRS